LAREISQLEIERVALAKERDEASRKRLQDIEGQLVRLKEEHQKLLSQWRSEKAPLEKIRVIKEKVEQVQQEFVRAERAGDYARASELKYGRLVQLEKELAAEQEKLGSGASKLIKEAVDEHDVAKVLARWTGIPVEKLETSESEKLLGMEAILKRRVVGQDEAIAQVTHAIQMHRAGLADPNRPIGSFIFLGPTGVGKTEVAKTLADFLFNDARHLVRIDMSEYMERHSVARLIGAPPGYVGYEEGGQLTEAIRRNPFSVVLFDEIEKAHPEVFNLFLQILDEGHLTDGQGRTVSFKNAIIIMTSNIGSSMILQEPALTPDVKAKITKLLFEQFRPEFLNRVDAIVFFNKLSQGQVTGIARIQIQQLVKRLAERQIVVSIDDAVVAYIAEIGYEPEFGARPLKRAIKSTITVPLSQELLKNPEKKAFHVALVNNKIIFT